MRFLPFIDLKPYPSKHARADFLAASSVLFMAIPQGIAYALIAGIPPVMGLYAATVPTIVGSLMRSSRHVITGPTNALSLLFAGTLALNLSADPAEIALTTALMVGLFQILAGWFRVGALIGLISSSVVLGYITGAGVLIAVGQLPNLTGTSAAHGNIYQMLSGWFAQLDSVSWLSVSIGLTTTLFIAALKKFRQTLPSPVIAIVLATLCSSIFGLSEGGLSIIQNISPIPSGFPQFTQPDLSLVPSLLPIAFALTMLSLVESSSVARTLAFESKQPIDNNVEFSGQGLANITAAFCGGYPISGSPSRSKLNQVAGAQTRMAGVLSGTMMLAVLAGFGELINQTPLAALAGLLMIVAWDLIDLPRIRATLRSALADKVSFLITLVATCTLTLDLAIYTGIALSILMNIMGYRKLRAFQYSIRGTELQATPLSDSPGLTDMVFRVVGLDGKLFFGAETKLRKILKQVLTPEVTRCVVIHIEDKSQIDFSIATCILEFSNQLQAQDGTLILSGLSPSGRKQIEEVQALYPDSRPEFLTEGGNWTLEKHQNALDFQK
ncbi:MAG: SulP family inorganic anion transporter [Deltaproteobacteria bacterium]|nr:SulP family inorganic anion transporter [Deltaproteobacteria bacterium]MBT6433432.1 SulP family inorganic anion transporter [Deltaproteobacteria bacterium]